MADGIGQPFSYPTASLAAPPVVIGSPAGGGAGFNLQVPVFQPSAPKYWDPNSLPGVIPPVDYSNIIKGLQTGIQAGVQIGQIPVTQRKQALQNQMMGFMQDRMKSQTAPQQPGESDQAYQDRINRFTAGLQFDAQGNVIYNPQAAAVTAKTYAEIPKTEAETKETLARTGLTVQQIETEIQKGQLTYAQAIAQLAQAGVSEAEAKTKLGPYYILKNDGTYEFNYEKYGLKKPQTVTGTETKQTQTKQTGLTETTYKGHRVRVDSSGRPVQVYNPDTKQWETQ